MRGGLSGVDEGGGARRCGRGGCEESDVWWHACVRWHRWHGRGLQSKAIGGNRRQTTADDGNQARATPRSSSRLMMPSQWPAQFLVSEDATCSTSSSRSSSQCTIATCTEGGAETRAVVRWRPSGSLKDASFHKVRTPARVDIVKRETEARAGARAWAISHLLRRRGLVLHAS